MQLARLKELLGLRSFVCIDGDKVRVNCEAMERLDTRLIGCDVPCLTLSEEKLYHRFVSYQDGAGEDEEMAALDDLFLQMINSGHTCQQTQEK